MLQIMLVDDHALFRKGLKTLLEMEKDIVVSAEATDAASALFAYIQSRPQIVLLDYSLPDEDGLSVLHSLLNIDPQARVIMLSAFDFEAQVLECVRAGARGYLSKDIDPDELMRAVHTVETGGIALSAEHMAALMQGAPMLSAERNVDLLTAREHEVAELVANGLKNKDIADVLGLSPATVKAHVANILAKLGLSSRVEIASWVYGRSS